MLKKANVEDVLSIAKLASCMWHSPLDELKQEFDDLLKSEKAVVFLKYSDNEPIGFAQCQLRYDYVEGTDSSPVGYLEGIFIKDDFRHRGYATELLAKCEMWAKEQGCAEFASDCELDNKESLFFHLNSGFEEANRIICFTKRL